MKGSIGSAARLDIGALGEMPVLIPSGKLNLAAAVAEQAAFLVPFKAEIVNIICRVRTATTVAQSVANVGKPGTVGYFGSITVPAATAAGTIVPYVKGTSLKVAAGDVIIFNSAGGATVGDCDILVVLRPDPA